VNKMDLVAKVAERNDLPRSKAAELVETVLAAIGKALKQRQEVRLAGFGTFAIATRTAGTGRNPRTGVEITIPESNSVRFKPGKSLKDSLN
jgi:DNA-binding protein HU-beta